eukprot:3027225-Alexandrium_andersonii.AAC.1
MPPPATAGSWPAPKKVGLGPGLPAGLPPRAGPAPRDPLVRLSPARGPQATWMQRGPWAMDFAVDHGS